MSTITPSLSTLPNELKYLILKDVGVKSLHSVRRTCRLFYDLINSQLFEPIWRALCLRKGLRDMTPQEQTSLTYQRYLRKNWSFCQLKKILDRHPAIKPELLVRFFHKQLKLATQAGHGPLVCKVLDRCSDKDFVRPILIEAITRKQSLIARKALQILSGNGDLKVGVLIESLRTAIEKGDVEIAEQIIACEIPLEVFDSLFVGVQLQTAAGSGNVQIVALLLEHYGHRISATYKQIAYLRAQNEGHENCMALLVAQEPA